MLWALWAGGTLEDRPRYNKSLCFDPFPFPATTASQRTAIGAVAEELDAHRKARLAAHPHLTLTGLYNVLIAVRSGKPLRPVERDVHDAGRVSILRTLHDRLDAVVAASYGWPADLSDAAVVARVVALNAERMKDEAAGTIRWLRPDFQAPTQIRRPTQTALAVEQTASAAATPWPRETPTQFIALRTALSKAGRPVTPRDLARSFRNPPRDQGEKFGEMLETLAALGQARRLADGRYAS